MRSKKGGDVNKKRDQTAQGTKNKKYCVLCKPSHLHMSETQHNYCLEGFIPPLHGLHVLAMLIALSPQSSYSVKLYD